MRQRKKALKPETVFNADKVIEVCRDILSTADVVTASAYAAATGASEAHAETVLRSMTHRNFLHMGVNHLVGADGKPAHEFYWSFD